MLQTDSMPVVGKRWKRKAQDIAHIKIKAIEISVWPQMDKVNTITYHDHPV